jgi:hypothetical protein
MTSPTRYPAPVLSLVRVIDARRFGPKQFQKTAKALLLLFPTVDKSPA